MAPQEQPDLQPAPAQAPPAPMNEFTRIAMVFSSPREAFKDIARSPRWWIPVLIIAAMGTIYSFAFGAKIGWDRAGRQILEASPQAANMTPQQMEQAISRIATVARFQQYLGILTTALLILIVAAVMKFLFDVLMGADLGMNRYMGIVGYANLPLVISTALTLLVLNLKSPEDFSVTNPLAFNVGAFLPDGTAPWLRGLGASLDLFSFWVIALIAIGVSSATRKISFGKALVTVLIPWGLYVLLRAGALALQSARS